MKNKIFKILFILSICLFVVLINYVDATSMISEIEGSINKGTDVAKTTVNIGQNVLGLIQVAGVGIAIVMLMFVAIKYLTASPEARGDIKRSLIIYVVGAILIIAATTIFGIIQKLAVGVASKI